MTGCVWTSHQLSAFLLHTLLQLEILHKNVLCMSVGGGGVSGYEGTKSLGQLLIRGFVTHSMQLV